MLTHEFYDGIMYQIEYKSRLSKLTYTKEKVYFIKTEDTSYTHAKKAISSIMETLLGYKQGSIWFIGEYEFKNQREPSMANALHSYYKFSYNEDLDVFIYTYVEPYDD